MVIKDFGYLILVGAPMCNILAGILLVLSGLRKLSNIKKEGRIYLVVGTFLLIHASLLMFLKSFELAFLAIPFIWFCMFLMFACSALIGIQPLFNFANSRLINVAVSIFFLILSLASANEKFSLGWF